MKYDKCNHCMNFNKCDYITCRIEEDAKMRKEVRNATIDEFVEKMKYEFGNDEIHNVIDEIAKKMKAGE